MFKWLDLGVRFLIENVFKFSMETRLGESVHFFIYDTIKIIILLSMMVFLISYIRTYFSLGKTKKILERFDGIGANFIASLFGIVTPFCSCSSVPLFIGFVEAEISLGVTFSFLITSPIVNEAAFAILLASFGWKVALAYVVMGVSLGTIGGYIIGKFGMEKEIEGYVFNVKVGDTTEIKKTQIDRLFIAKDTVMDIVKKVWLFLIIGIGIGALIHGWAPEAFMVKYAGSNNPFAVFIAVIAGIPLYANALGTIPIAEALINKGVGLGTALSFMMAVTALSVPEMILLRKVIKPKLIACFVIITGIGIVIIGYAFNYIG